MKARSVRAWVFDPHSGGAKIPEALKEQTKRRILAHAQKHYAGRYHRLDIRFRGPLCYIDAFIEPPGSFASLPPEEATHLCRLRHKGQDRWSVDFFTYSHERYEPSFFASGDAIGTPEEGFDVGAVYLA